MKFKSITLVLILGYAIADNTIILDQKQLEISQKEIGKQGNQAISELPNNSKKISNIKLKNLNLTDINEQINQSKNKMIILYNLSQIIKLIKLI